MKKINKDSPFKLFVEGVDDKAVVTNVVNWHNPTLDYYVIEYESDHVKNQATSDPKLLHGVERITQEFEVRLKVADFRALGIVVDADFAETGNGVDKRWSTLKGILRRAGYDTPDALDSDGLVVEKDGLRIGVWIMPDNASEGMLEDFVASMIGGQDPLFELASRSIDSIPISERRFSPNHRLKALVHTWLAWQIEPGKPFGVAIQKKYLDANSDAAKSLFAWLSRLFA